jgi:hypothetical protein
MGNGGYRDTRRFGNIPNSHIGIQSISREYLGRHGSIDLFRSSAYRKRLRNGLIDFSITD